MVIFNFIGYFILVLHDFPLPGTTWPFSCSDFSGFISLLCHPYLPATFSGLRPRLFSSDPPPCYNMRTGNVNISFQNCYSFGYFDLQLDLLMTQVQSVIRGLPKSLSHVEESMAGHMGVNRVY
jgi:hypothetical protein